MTSSSSASTPIPSRLQRNGRPEDQDFEPTETLYHRCQKPDILNNGRFNPDSVKFPDWSVNREKYSEPNDVLLPNYADWGIATFQVQDVEPLLFSDGGSRFDFRVIHVPKEDNYAHSELRTFKNGRHSRKTKPSKTVKKTFRILLSEQIHLLKQPQC